MEFESTENKVRVIPCADWSVFRTEATKSRAVKVGTDGVNGLNAAVLFRGHAQSDWRLSSTLERTLSISYVKPPTHLRAVNGVGWYNDECAKILDTFTRNAKGLPGFSEGDIEVSQWMFGRHHGLLQPYLDWTTSPFVAAFFALENVYSNFKGLREAYPMNYRGIVHVWGLRLWSDASEHGVFEIENPRMAHGTRARAQSGVLTRLRSKEHIDLESFLTARGQAYFLERYDIRLESALQALNDLELMNIKYMTLYPDVAGAAADANMQKAWIRTHDVFRFFGPDSR